MSEKLHEKIVAARKRKGISQDELADLAGINIRTVQRIESGVSVPRGHTLRRLCEALALELDDMFEDEDEEYQYDYKGYILFMYFSVWFGFVVPFANMLVPGLMWLRGRKFSDAVNLHGKEILKIQFMWSLFMLLGFMMVVSTTSNYTQLSVKNIVLPDAAVGTFTNMVVPATSGFGEILITFLAVLVALIYLALLIFQLAYPLIANNVVNKGVPRFTVRYFPRF